MTITVFMVLFVVLLMAPLAAGWLLGRRCGADSGVLAPTLAAAIWMALVAIWLVCALAARWYGDSGLWGWSIAERFAHSGKWFTFAVISLGGFGYAAGVSAEQRTHVVALLGISLCAFITVWKTFPVYPFIQSLAIRGDDGTLRQSTQATCGPVALANAIDRVGGYSVGIEKSLAMRCGTTCEGTTRWSVWRAAMEYGFTNAVCRRMSLEEMERIGGTSIVSIATMPGVNHATLYVGTFESVVILLDPQYGLCTMSRRRFRETLYGNPIVLAPGAKGAPGPVVSVNSVDFVR